MVAVRSAHLNKAGEFDPQKWIASLGISSQQSCERLTETWAYCLRTTQGHPDAELLLWRGVEMVEILSMLSMDIDTLLAAMLFPLADAEVVSEEVLRESVGKSIVSLIHGVRDMAAIRQLKATHTDSVSSEQVDNVRRMLLAMVDDFRCVVIKLAERVAHLREVKDAPEDERVLAAKECTNIYAPLANRLGIGQLKWELEDYCFRYLHPAEYKRIAKLLHERRIDREHYIEEFVGGLRKSMKEEGVKAEVYGRPKHIYSIWRKMQKKHLAFDELFDVRAVRIVAERLQDCYAALGIVHTHYRHMPDEFDDYVANPKPNGYQSIHTVVLGPGGKPVEIQIRTKQMHEESELGVAAHWKYKEGTSGGARSGHEDRIAWLRKLIAWQEEMADSGEMLDEVRSQVFDDRVYVFTPKGDVVDLPAGSTPLDFAYHIHSDVGHRCIGAKIGGRIVPFTYQLQMGDQIEIITQKQPNPSRDWLNPNLGYVTTSRGRSKIHAWFRKQDRDKNILAGRQILDDELEHIGISLKEAEKFLLPRYNFNELDELLAAIGGGDIRLNQMVNFLGIMQNEWAGAQAFSSFDTYLAPFVKVDHLSYDEVKKCVESFVYGVNTPSRWGTQAPFSNITLDWVVPSDLAQQPAIISPLRFHRLEQYFQRLPDPGPTTLRDQFQQRCVGFGIGNQPFTQFGHVICDVPEHGNIRIGRTCHRGRKSDGRFRRRGHIRDCARCGFG